MYKQRGVSGKLWFTESQKRCQNVSKMKCSKPVLHQNPLLFSRTVDFVCSNHAYITRYTTLAIIPSQPWSRILHRPETETWTICTLRLDPTEHIRYFHLQPETQLKPEVICFLFVCLLSSYLLLPIPLLIPPVVFNISTNANRATVTVFACSLVVVKVCSEALNWFWESGFLDRPGLMKARWASHGENSRFSML